MHCRCIFDKQILSKFLIHIFKSKATATRVVTQCWNLLNTVSVAYGSFEETNSSSIVVCKLLWPFHKLDRKKYWKGWSNVCSYGAAFQLCPDHTQYTICSWGGWGNGNKVSCPREQYQPSIEPGTLADALAVCYCLPKWQ